MTVHVCGMIRVASAAENFVNRGSTYGLIYKAVGGVPVPQGRYPIQLFSIRCTQVHPHDPQWGAVDLEGDLIGLTDVDSVADYFRAAILAISEVPYISVNQAVIHIMPDGGQSIMLDHWDVIKMGIETLGDDA